METYTVRGTVIKYSVWVEVFVSWTPFKDRKWPFLAALPKSNICYVLKRRRCQKPELVVKYEELAISKSTPKISNHLPRLVTYF